MKNMKKKLKDQSRVVKYSFKQVDVASSLSRPHSSLDDLTPDEIYYEPEKSLESLLETVAEIWE